MFSSARFDKRRVCIPASKPAANALAMPVLICLGVIIFAAGWIAGIGQAGEGARGSSAHIAGACMALEMAEAHLVLDGTAKVVIAKALTQPLNPYRDLFPATSKGILSLCSDVRAHRYASPDSSVTKLSSR